MNQDKIWDYFQNEANESFDGSQPRLEFLCNKLTKGQHVLNIGVGNGQFERQAKKSEINIHSLDPNEKSIENLKVNLGLPDSKAKVGYSQSIPYSDELFDAVIMSEVLEHLDDETLQKTLAEVRRVLTNGGVFLITVPFNEALSSNNAACPNCELIFHRWGHVQSFTQKSLQAIVKKAGFEIRKNEVRSFPDWSRKGIKNLVKSSLRYILGRFGAGIANPIIFLAVIKNKQGL